MEKYKDAQKSYEDALRILDTESGSEIKNLSEVKITIHLHLAMSKFNNGDSNGALKELANSELNDDRLTPSLLASKSNCKGLCNYRKELFSEAEKDYKRSLDSNYNLSITHYNVAVLYSSQPQEAVSCH